VAVLPPPHRPVTEPNPFAVDNLPLRLAKSSLPALPGPLAALTTTAKAQNTAVAWRQVADTASKLNFHGTAADAYTRESAIYLRTGDKQAAEAEKMKAETNSASLVVAFEHPVTPADTARLDSKARLEPPTGCYIGAFIDRDNHLESTMQDGGQTHGNAQQFEQLVGKAHASYFMYLSYGKAFPAQWVETLKEAGAIPHISWEPNGMSDVHDDEYLRRFVAAARAADWPIFIRFACEMNGNWTSYHADPALYRKTFAMVHHAFQDCPKVAFIWCPNAVPRANIDDYYPGDAAVDWVGVNFYSTMYLNDDRNQPGDKIHPTDLLDPIYRRYGARKPIAIGEYAATHESHLDQKPRPEFAVRRIDELYAALQTRYPRVKLVDWYDRDNIRGGLDAGKTHDNFLLTEDPQVLAAYRRAIAPAWFLGAQSGTGHEASATVWQTLSNGATLPTALTLRASVRCWTTTPHVYFTWDHKVCHATNDPGAFGLHLEHVAKGPHQVRVTVLDDDNRPVADQSYRVKVL
jgi:hypothetical protein